MIATRPIDLRARLKKYLEYSELMKAKRNAEYLLKLEESLAQFKRGETISFTMEELEAMEADDWKPTAKVLEFEKKHGIQR